MNKKRIKIGNFEELEEESKKLPDLNRIVEIVPQNPLEEYFFDVAEKHGVIDLMLEQDEEGW